MRFWKYHGTGNDFIITTPEASGLGTPATEQIKKLCDRHFGIGADGFVLLNKISEKNFSWDFYNSDGSKAAMCGNASRCVGLYINDIFKIPHFHLQTGSGDVEVQLTGPGQLRVQLGLPKLLAKGPPPLIDSGVPHLIIQTSDPGNLKKNSLKAMTQRARSDFPKGGSNITFVSPPNQRVIVSTTFERGVDGFTLSCGTGALASGFFYEMTEREEMLGKPWTVKVLGGELTVAFFEKHASLEGPAARVGEITIDKRLLS